MYNLGSILTDKFRCVCGKNVKYGKIPIMGGQIVCE